MKKVSIVMKIESELKNRLGELVYEYTDFSRFEVYLFDFKLEYINKDVISVVLYYKIKQFDEVNGDYVEIDTLSYEHELYLGGFINVGKINVKGVIDFLISEDVQEIESYIKNYIDFMNRDSIREFFVLLRGLLFIVFFAILTITITFYSLIEARVHVEIFAFVYIFMWVFIARIISIIVMAFDLIEEIEEDKSVKVNKLYIYLLYVSIFLTYFVIAVVSLFIIHRHAVIGFVFYLITTLISALSFYSIIVNYVEQKTGKKVVIVHSYDEYLYFYKNMNRFKDILSNVNKKKKPF